MQLDYERQQQENEEIRRKKEEVSLRLAHAYIQI